MTEDEIRAAREKCADCSGQMQEITVYCTDLNEQEVLLPFAGRAAKKNWLGRWPREGVLMAFMCNSCARVAFYGATNEGKGK